MHKTQGRSVGLGLALLSAFAFGGSGVAAKPLIEAGLDPLHVVWLRVTGAAVVMLPVAWRHRDLVRRKAPLLIGFSLLAVAGVQACYFAAISRIPVGVALLVEYLAPALVLLWVRFVQRRPVTRAAAVGVVLAAGGLSCVVEVWAGLTFDAVGLLLALAAACCQVGYFLLSDQGNGTADAADPLGVIAYGLLGGSLVLTVVARPWGMNWSLLGGSADMGGSEVWAALLLGWIVLIATVLAYVTGVVSVRRLSPQVAGVVACLEAVIATVLAWVLLKERLSMPQIVGGAVVLAGALVAQSSAPGGSSRPRAAGPDPMPARVRAVQRPVRRCPPPPMRPAADPVRADRTCREAPARDTWRMPSPMNVWVPVADETGAVARLLTAGWAVAPGARFRVSAPQAVRVTVSAMIAEDIGAVADAPASATASVPARSYG